jgi:hypothetical protein
MVVRSSSIRDAFTYAIHIGVDSSKELPAHNTVCVDDLDQVDYRRGKPKVRSRKGVYSNGFTAAGLT